MRDNLRRGRLEPGVDVGHPPPALGELVEVLNEIQRGGCMDLPESRGADPVHGAVQSGKRLHGYDRSAAAAAR